MCRAAAIIAANVNEIEEVNLHITGYDSLVKKVIVYILKNYKSAVSVSIC